MEVKMRAFFVFAIFICVTFQGFSQDANSDKYKALSESMDRTISSTNSKLETYDEMARDSGNTKSYSSYNRKYETIKFALNQSEQRLDLLIRTNDKPSIIKEERDNYEELKKHLEDLKSEYDKWQSSVK